VLDSKNKVKVGPCSEKTYKIFDPQTKETYFVKEYQAESMD
jgi:hypothetical protein